MPFAKTDLPELVAAVDLGSNSFHMIVAGLKDDQLQVIDRLREMVRLAAGLDDKRRLTTEATQRALACLERFGQRLRDMPPGSVRAVGTNTLRQARNAKAFLAAAERALGHPIEVISGIEEARLVYLGVAQGVPTDDKRRLVIDIGGGSTEVIIGRQSEPIAADSLYMGCVSMSRAHFADGAISRKRMRRAELAARVEFEPLENQYRTVGWDSATGTSGTIRAIEAVVHEAGWCDEGITLSALEHLAETLVKAGHVERLRLSGLSDERVPVFPGGVAILLAAFHALGIDRLQVSDRALREGLLYDLVGRIRHQDVRGRSVDTLAAGYQVDAKQAQRVEHTALHCLGQVAAAWGLGDEQAEQLLAWAARLHELGLAIAHSQYHKHGAYIVQHSDLPGFSRAEQALLAALVRGHRRKFRTAIFQTLPEDWSDAVQHLAVLLRLAVLLHRGRGDAPLPEIKLATEEDGLHVDFPAGWLDAHPLTHADLAQEAGDLKKAGLTLSFD